MKYWVAWNENTEVLKKRKGIAIVKWLTPFTLHLFGAVSNPVDCSNYFNSNVSLSGLIIIIRNY